MCVSFMYLDSLMEIGVLCTHPYYHQTAEERSHKEKVYMYVCETLVFQLFPLDLLYGHKGE